MVVITHLLTLFFAPCSNLVPVRTDGVKIVTRVPYCYPWPADPRYVCHDHLKTNIVYSFSLRNRMYEQNVRGLITLTQGYLSPNWRLNSALMIVSKHVALDFFHSSTQCASKLFHPGKLSLESRINPEPFRSTVNFSSTIPP